MNQANFEIVNDGIKLVRFFDMAPSPYSFHEHLELLIVQKGPVTVTIDDCTFTLHEGDIAFTPSFVSHKNDEARDILMDALVFSRSICAESEKLFDGRRLIRPYLRKKEVPALLDQLIRFLIFRVSGQKQDMAKSGKHTIFLDMKHCKDLPPYISALLAELKRLMPTASSKFSDYSVVQQVLQYCSNHFRQDITREQVANACHLPANRVSEIFSILNSSFPEYINNLRLNLAYSYLVSTKLSIAQIMQMCGYINQGTFNRNFYLRFNQTPSQVRRLPQSDNMAAISELQEIIYEE